MSQRAWIDVMRRHPRLAGFPMLALKGVPILARAASLIAHLLEEQQRPIGFALSNAGASAIGYDGPAPAGFVPGED